MIWNFWGPGGGGGGKHGGEASPDDRQPPAVGCRPGFVNHHLPMAQGGRQREENKGPFSLNNVLRPLSFLHQCSEMRHTGTSVRAPFGDEFLLPKADLPVAAFACLQLDSDLVHHVGRLLDGEARDSLVPDLQGMWDDKEGLSATVGSRKTQG